MPSAVLLALAAFSVNWIIELLCIPGPPSSLQGWLSSSSSVEQALGQIASMRDSHLVINRFSLIKRKD